MFSGYGDNRQRVERRLSDVHTRLLRARSELEVAEEQLGALSDDAEEAKIRMLVAETPVANRDYREAARHAEVMARTADRARALVAELEQAQDELLAKLVV